MSELLRNLHDEHLDVMRRFNRQHASRFVPPPGSLHLRERLRVSQWVKLNGVALHQLRLQLQVNVEKHGALGAGWGKISARFAHRALANRGRFGHLDVANDPFR